MVNFIHNQSDVTTWMGHSFKIKSTKSRATFLRHINIYIHNNFFFEFQAADHQISTRTVELNANSLKQLFIAVPM